MTLTSVDRRILRGLRMGEMDEFLRRKDLMGEMDFLFCIMVSHS